MSQEINKLVEAVVKVMAEVRSVPKTGFNSHYKYSYASDEDICGALQPAMAKHGLALIPTSVVATNTHTRADLIVTYTLLHVSGQSMTVQSCGTGVDTQDKAYYKAMTGALKYALRGVFVLPIGEDPEKADGDKPGIRPAQQRQEPPQQEPETPPRNYAREFKAYAAKYKLSKQFCLALTKELFGQAVEGKDLTQDHCRKMLAHMTGETINE